ncbi:MAG: glutamate 5-kinase [Kiritimatiellae bacterium]|nr:glutamate 5-kinase [Kiritimatiellia bacterium]
MKSSQNPRLPLTRASRLVIKVGTRVLAQKSGRPHVSRIKALVREVAALVRSGREILLVSSGAIGAGMQALGMKRRPTSLPDLQMAAAVGQSRLMALYDELFAKEKLRVGQILLTHDDLRHRERHLNARNTIARLLSTGVVPIINENDVVSVDEIRFGDNDLLAALVALLVHAELVILLTTTDGVREPAGAGRSRRLATLRAVTRETYALANGKGSDLSTGGMLTKLQSAEEITRAGGTVVIANGTMPRVLARIVTGEDVGTVVLPQRPVGGSAIKGRKRWIAFFHRAAGTITIDDGAREAVRKKGRSLLPRGITAVEGQFEVGALVNIKSADGTLIARGLVGYGSDDIRTIQGARTADIARLLGRKDYDEVVHRDNMVVLGS